MAEGWSIEVVHVQLAAGRWRDTCASRLTGSAVTAGSPRLNLTAVEPPGPVRVASPA